MINAAAGREMTNLIMVLIVSAWKPQVPLAKTCHMLYLTFKGSGSISMEVLPGIFPEMLIFFFPESQVPVIFSQEIGKTGKSHDSPARFKMEESTQRCYQFRGLTRVKLNARPRNTNAQNQRLR